MEQITAAFTTGVQSIVTDVTGLVAGILPIGLTLLGIGIAVGYALKFTKKVTK